MENLRLKETQCCGLDKNAPQPSWSKLLSPVADEKWLTAADGAGLIFNLVRRPVSTIYWTDSRTPLSEVRPPVWQILTSLWWEGEKSVNVWLPGSLWSHCVVWLQSGRCFWMICLILPIFIEEFYSSEFLSGVNQSSFRRICMFYCWWFSSKPTAVWLLFELPSSSKNAGNVRTGRTVRERNEN